MRSPDLAAPSVSVIIPHLDAPEDLARCLDGVTRQQFAASDYEVIVVDNGSSVGLSSVQADYPNVLFIQEQKKGAAHARNAGLAVARGKIIAFTDADCVPSLNWLAQGVNALDRADMAGGGIDVVADDPRVVTAVEAFEQVFAFHQKTYVHEGRFAATANLFVHADVAAAIGPFHHGGAEDKNWCRRGAALGYQISYAPLARIAHPARKDWCDLTLKWGRLVRERWADWAPKTLATRIKWLALAIVVGLSWAPHLFWIVFSREIHGVGTRIRAMAILIRIRVWRARRMFGLLGVGAS